jgi:hypothetical protein
MRGSVSVTPAEGAPLCRTSDSATLREPKQKLRHQPAVAAAAVVAANDDSVNLHQKEINAAETPTQMRPLACTSSQLFSRLQSKGVLAMTAKGSEISLTDLSTSDQTHNFH